MPKCLPRGCEKDREDKVDGSQAGPMTHPNPLGATPEGKAGWKLCLTSCSPPPPAPPPTDCFHVPGAGRPDAQALGPGWGAEQVVFWTEAHDHARSCW